MRDVESAKIVCLRLAQQRPDVGRSRLEFLQVEEPVLVVQPQERRLALMQGRAEGSANAGTDQTDDDGGVLRQNLPPPNRVNELVRTYPGFDRFELPRAVPSRRGR